MKIEKIEYNSGGLMVAILLRAEEPSDCLTLEKLVKDMKGGE